MLRELAEGHSHLLHPKMAFFLTSMDSRGRSNIMACAWATPVSDEPPVVVVCVAKNSHTALLVRETKEFVINIPERNLLKALWICGRTSGKDTDKFAKAGLKKMDAKKVSPPLIEGCIGFIECRLWKTVDAGECYAFFGKILSASADDTRFRRSMWTQKAAIPFHLGGSKMVYCTD